MPFVTHQDQNVLFIHVPKTGGTTVSRWMAQHGEVHFLTVGRAIAFNVAPQHLLDLDLMSLFGTDFFAYKFAVVRNPYDRIESEYRYRVDLSKRTNRLRLPTFSLWLERHMKQVRDRPMHLDNHLRPQVDFIGSSVEVFRFEDGLQLALSQVAAATGMQAPDSLPVLRAGEDAIDRVEWGISERLLVNRQYAEDFEYFGYEKLT